jgi:hypothetical protein
MRWSIGRSTLAACEPRHAFSVTARGATVGKDYQWLLPARHGLSDAGRDAAPRFSKIRRVNEFGFDHSKALECLERAQDRRAGQASLIPPAIQRPPQRG